MMSNTRWKATVCLIFAIINPIVGLIVDSDTLGTSGAVYFIGYFILDSMAEGD